MASPGDGATGCRALRGAGPPAERPAAGPGKRHVGGTRQTRARRCGHVPRQARGRRSEAPAGKWRQNLGPRAPDGKGAGPSSCPPSSGPAEWPPGSRAPGVLAEVRGLVLTHPSGPWPMPPHSPLPRRLLRPGPCTWWLPAGRGVSPGSWVPEWRPEEVRSPEPPSTRLCLLGHLGSLSSACPPWKSWRPQQTGGPCPPGPRGPRGAGAPCSAETHRFLGSRARGQHVSDPVVEDAATRRRPADPQAVGRLRVQGQAGGRAPANCEDTMAGTRGAHEGAPPAPPPHSAPPPRAPPCCKQHPP